MFVATFRGRLGDDAEVTEVNGKTKVRFRAVSSRRYTDAKGNKVERATWMTFDAWNGIASGIAQYLVKGKEVFVTGRLEQSDYEKDGQKRTSYSVNVTDIELGADPRDSTQQSSTPARTSNRPSKRAPIEDYDEDAGDDDGGDEKAPW